MERAKVAEIQKAVADFVASHPEWGVKVAKNNASYGVGEMKLSLTLRASDDDSQAKSFAQVAHFYGVKPEAFGAAIHTTRGMGKLVGFNPSRPKYPVRVQFPGGKEYLYTTDVLSRLAV